MKRTLNRKDGSTALTRLLTVAIFGATAIIMLIVSAVAVGKAAAATFVLNIALLAAGFIVGLLFSLPRFNAREKGPTNEHSVSGAQDGGGARSLYDPNTNLDEVSDWLTKIIVGVGLVEAKNLFALLWKAANTLGSEFASTANLPGPQASTALAMGMLSGFPLVGFLLGFFSTRLYISKAIRKSDDAVFSLTARDVRKVNKEWEERTAVPPEAEETVRRGAPESVPDATKEALNISPKDVGSEEDLVTLGRAAVLDRKPSEAQRFLESAINQGDQSPEVYLDYCTALMSSEHPDWRKIKKNLEVARSMVDRNTPRETQQRLRWLYLNANLYLPRPEGLETTIRTAKEYIAAGLADPYIYVYLASAYGQQYSYYRSNDGPEKAAALSGLKNAISEALELSTARSRKIIVTWLSNLATRDTTDDDLADAFEDHPELHDILKEQRSGSPDRPRPMQ